MNRLCLVLILLLVLAGCEPQPPAIQSGKSAPAFTLERLDGARVAFPEQYRGHVVAIRFWADWNPSCQDEMVELEPIYQQYRDRGLTILAVNVMQSSDAAKEFVEQIGISYEVLLDHEGEVMRQYQVMGLPMTFIVDRNGIIRTRIVGESTPEDFEKAIENLL